MTLPLGRGGALLVDKPEGPTSFGVVASVRGALGRSFGLKHRELPAVGHGGTLDPFATGLLIVLIGQATKLAQVFLDSEKRYTGTMRFGVRTASGDFTEPILEQTTTLPQSLESLSRAAHTFVGTKYFQVPPMFSAKKRDGKALYTLARAGIEVEREPKLCQISRFEITSFDGACAEFSVSCSAGTYIRVLAEDLALKLGSLAALESLRRTGSGELSVDQSLSLAHASAHVSDWTESKAWVSLDHLARTLPALELSPDQALSVERGQQGVLKDLTPKMSTKLTALFCNQRLCAIARVRDGRAELERVFPL